MKDFRTTPHNVMPLSRSQKLNCPLLNLAIGSSGELVLLTSYIFLPS